MSWYSFTDPPTTSFTQSTVVPLAYPPNTISFNNTGSCDEAVNTTSRLDTPA
jgi:hypothetical protein